MTIMEFYALLNQSLPSAILKEVIEKYTREAGVRNLRRQIATIARKAAKIILEEKVEKVSITSKNGIVSSSENSTFYYTAPEIGKNDILTLSYKDSAGIIKEMEYNILLKSKITFLIYMGAQNSLGTSGFAAAEKKK
jgi:ATP-dependent Lon protease